MTPTRRLFRLPQAGRLAGVCAGIADYLGADVTLVRVAWIVLSIWPGCLFGGVLAYLIAWMLMPVSDASIQQPDGRRLTRSVTDRKVSGVCGGLAEFMDIDSTIVRVTWAVLTIVPGAVVLGVAAYLLAWIIIPSDPQHVTAVPTTA